MALLAAILVFTFVGCSSSPAVALINGEELSKEMYMYYLNNDKVGYVMENSIRNPESFWESGTIEDMNAVSYIKQMALDEAVSGVVSRQKALEAGLTLSEGDKKRMTDYIDYLKEQGAESYQKFLSENFLSEKLLLEVIEIMTYEEIYMYHLIGAKEYFDTEMVRVKHILIKTVDDSMEPLPEEEVAAAREKAEAILADLQNGADFEAYIVSDGEDPGMSENPDGYIFGPNGQMVQEFTEASLGLEVGGVSGLVETSYGYHIIKKYPLDESFYESVKGVAAQEIGQEKEADYIAKMKEAVDSSLVVQTKEYNKIK